jgi:molybdopterin-containing oxidoreductase family iron-sulfur binding subunit
MPLREINAKDVHEHGRIALSLADAENEQGTEPGAAPSSPSRRDFLKLAGFALTNAALAGCQRAPVQYAVPYLIPPAGLIPGRSYDYASTCGGCSAGCGMLVKNHDGRPIKLEGNPDHPLSRGGLCAAGQASLLGLYDQQRLRHALQEGQQAEWTQVDAAIGKQLEAIREQRGVVRFLTGPGVSPTTRALLHRFLTTFANARHVVLDPRSCSAILEAHGRTHGSRLLPHYRLDKAEVIVSFDADFLGTWISPVEFTAAYQAGRRLEGPDGQRLEEQAAHFSKHVQFESLLSLTGTKADRRVCLAPADIGAAMSHLATRLAKKAGVRLDEGRLGEASVSSEFLHELDDLAEDLWRKRRHSLILCGSQDVDLQVLCNFLNHVLGNYGTTVDLAQPSYQRDGNDAELEVLLQELHDGKVSALFIYQCDPVHDLPSRASIAEDLKRVPLLVSLNPRLDETTPLARFACPDHHYLESWSDAEPVNGLVTLVQPAITPLGSTRSVIESLAAWMGKPPRAAYDLIREHWEKEVFPRRAQKDLFQDFWDRTLHDGFADVRARAVKVGAFDAGALHLATRGSRPQQGTYSLILYSKVGMPDASHAYNPWLHELPDPITKVTWDNYACLSPAAAGNLGVADGDVIRLEAAPGGDQPVTLELPAFVQPGLHDQAVGVALGYGSLLSKRFANIGPAWLQARPTVGPDGLVGKNAAPFLALVEGSLRFRVDGVRLRKTGGQHPLASTQNFYQITVPKHLSLPGQERRPIIRETTLAALGAAVRAGPPEKASAVERRAEEEDLWPADHPVTGPGWGMAIDLSACTGCSACVIACQAENNIPVVGKDEVRRQREMHWLRIDRYYTERDGGVNVAHQPMLCQQCGNAPCEVVCPVLATVHSDDGLNQQVYNRCVGTRYCANNCPYKVRRFNWFDYARDDLLQNLVLNPRVTVRSRGVMEKCTFCVQRIQEARIEAGTSGQFPRDGLIQTACQQSCPAQAIVFGNLNDPMTRVARLAGSSRSYQVLGELNVRPSVSYLTLVRNRPAEGEGEKDG